MTFWYFFLLLYIRKVFVGKEFNKVSGNKKLDKIFKILKKMY